MNRNYTAMDVQVSIEKGGMREFKKTGIYPSYIKFYLKEYKRTWRFKLPSDHQKGVLKYKGTEIYEYEFSDNTCKMRSVGKDKEVGDWYNIENFLLIMND